MSNLAIKKLVFSLILIIGSLFTLPSYAWPEVDHMNMCGSAVKTARAYGGGFKGWNSHDQYVALKSRSGAYYRANCPDTYAPSNVAPTKRIIRKKRIVRKKRRVRKVRRGRYVTKCRYVKRCTKVRAKRIKKRHAARKYPYIARSSRARKFRRTVKYDKHADCVRVDRVNRSGRSVRVVRR